MTAHRLWQQTSAVSLLHNVNVSSATSAGWGEMPIRNCNCTYTKLVLGRSLIHGKEQDSPCGDEEIYVSHWPDKVTRYGRGHGVQARSFSPRGVELGARTLWVNHPCFVRTSSGWKQKGQRTRYYTNKCYDIALSTSSIWYAFF